MYFKTGTKQNKKTSQNVKLKGKKIEYQDLEQYKVFFKLRIELSVELVIEY